MTAAERDIIKRLRKAVEAKRRWYYNHQNSVGATEHGVALETLAWVLAEIRKIEELKGGKS